MKRTLAFGALTLIGGLLGAFIGSYMQDEKAVVMCYVFGSIALPYGTMTLVKF